MDYLNRAELACKREMVLRRTRGNMSREYIAISFGVLFVLYFVALFVACSVLDIKLIG